MTLSDKLQRSESLEKLLEKMKSLEQHLVTGSPSQVRLCVSELEQLVATTSITEVRPALYEVQSLLAAMARQNRRNRLLAESLARLARQNLRFWLEVLGTEPVYSERGVVPNVERDVHLMDQRA